MTPPSDASAAHSLADARMGFIWVAGFLFIKWRLPETKGKTLEEIEQELT